MVQQNITENRSDAQMQQFVVECHNTTHEIANYHFPELQEQYQGHGRGK